MNLGVIIYSISFTDIYIRTKNIKNVQKVGMLLQKRADTRSRDK